MWREKISLQFVALAPLNFWQTYEGELLAQRVAFNEDLLGGVLTPPLTFGSLPGFKTLDFPEV